MGKVLNKATPEEMKKFGMYLEIRTTHTGRTGWQIVIRKAAGGKYRSFQRHGEII